MNQNIEEVKDMKINHYLELKNEIVELHKRIEKLEKRENFVKARLSPDERKMAKNANLG